MKQKQSYTAKQMLSALQTEKSIIRACKKLGISRATFYRKVNRLDLLKAKIRRERA